MKAKYNGSAPALSVTDLIDENDIMSGENILTTIH